VNATKVSDHNLVARNPVKAVLTLRGFIFYRTNGDDSAGPFTKRETDALEFHVNLAEKLHVEPKETVGAKINLEFPVVSFDDILGALSSTIKKDESTQLVTFAAMLLAQTEDNQINLGFEAESSAGKSYIPMEISAFFPREELIIVASASPTAFFHEVGQWDGERKATIVDLEGKILIFLDQPHFMLLERLRPLLSHDRKELQYKITDKSNKSGLRTKNVIIRGYPSVIFCSARLNPDEQEKTRMILLSPSIEQSKLEKSLELISKRQSNPDQFKEELENDPKRTFLLELVRAIRATKITKVIVPDDIDVLAQFRKEHDHLKARHQRDLPRIFSLIKAHALLNCFHREKVGQDTVMATQDDVLQGLKLYGMISASNELGLSPYILNIYEDVIKPLLNNQGVSRRDIQTKYYAIHHKYLSAQTLQKEILPALELAGLIVEEPDTDDKRRMLVYPPIQTTINQISKVDNEHRGDNSSLDRGPQIPR